jgi:hypothetical protein
MSAFMNWLNAPIVAANKRDQADDLEGLAAQHGLTFDADGWGCPCFMDEQGSVVLGRTSDMKWRFFQDPRSPYYDTASAAFRARPWVKP